jgi:Kef-type K+ transport system membrane component KefB
VWSTSDPISRLGLFVAVVLAAAKVAGDVASRLKQPSVLGELLIGILLGSLPFGFVRELRADAGLDLLGRIGVLVLMFEVGLESTVREVMRVGVASVRVALFGSMGTLVCGWIAARLAMPSSSSLAQLFVAAAMTATSIGISARVLKDAGVSRTKEGRTILGASVLDDILGLVVLALVSGAVVHAGGDGVGPWLVLGLVAKTLAFLAAALFLGVKLSPWAFRTSARLRTPGALVAAGLSLCFVLAWASDVVGLAPIVGAFAAGLILEESHSAPFVERGERSLGERMEPISSWLVPIFFVLMGMRADFRALKDPAALVLVGSLMGAAVVGKLACALAAPRGSDRVTVALGMVPRGEVSLVFANLGLTLHVEGRPLLDGRQYAALVTVVVLTTLATPPALRWRLASQAAKAPRHGERSRGPSAEPDAARPARANRTT